MLGFGWAFQAWAPGAQPAFRGSWDRGNPWDKGALDRRLRVLSALWGVARLVLQHKFCKLLTGKSDGRGIAQGLGWPQRHTGSRLLVAFYGGLWLSWHSLDLGSLWPLGAGATVGGCPISDCHAHIPSLLVKGPGLEVGAWPWVRVGPTGSPFPVLSQHHGLEQMLSCGCRWVHFLPRCDAFSRSETSATWGGARQGVRFCSQSLQPLR